MSSLTPAGSRAPENLMNYLLRPGDSSFIGGELLDVLGEDLDIPPACSTLRP